MPIGNVNDTTKGSGARYNDGKPDLSLIPIGIVAGTLAHRPETIFAAPNARILECLVWLGRWQEKQNPEFLYAALGELDEPLITAARVFTYGTKKYAAWNWAKGMAWSVPVACIGRHAEKVLIKNELLDPESGEPHEGHIACNIIMLIHFMTFFPEGNDITFAKILPTE